jgi:putative ABC transport system ATP-binding protein
LNDVQLADRDFKDRESLNSIEAENLQKQYGEGPEATLALRGVSFDVRKEDFVAIIGPSGSGKSTLLNIVGGLDRPSSGKVSIYGDDISKLTNLELARIRNQKIGFVFQSFNLINRMTASENIELPLAIANIPIKKRKEISAKLLDQFGLLTKAQRKPTELSGGEQQRIAVARALAANPEIILADEPTGNLDSKNTDAMMKILSDLNEKDGKTVILITHNGEVAAKARRTISMRDGAVQEIKEN